MCGIVGFFGPNGGKKFIIDGLKKLEYRGYDSWGMALLEKDGLKVFKETGKISTIRQEEIDSEGNVAIGHTRWATHGAVTQENAHPHTDCKKQIAVVHNGIINNYQTLKAELIKKGHSFSSETDTEVIPHLIEEYLKKETSLLEATRKALNDLAGNFAICVIAKGYSQIIVVASGCPLSIGLAKDEKYLSSDILAFPSETEKIAFLKDNQIVQIDQEIKAFDFKTGKSKKIVFEKFQSPRKNEGLDHFKHFLFKEINQQPEILEKIAQMQAKEIETNAALIRNSFGTFIVACGTAFHAGLVGEYLFAQNAKMHLNLSLASEFPAFRNFLTNKTLLLAISQSGETADVLEAVNSAKSKNVKIFSILNNPYSTLMRLSDVAMITPAGPEIAVLSTKAFTAQIAVLFLLSMAASDNLAKARKILQSASSSIRENFSEKNIDKIKKIAQRIKNTEHIFTLGRGLNFPTALEAALKIKEVSYIHAEGFAGGELKHGTIALIEKGVPCFVFVASDKGKEAILSNAEEVKARGGYIIGVSPENNPIFDEYIAVDDSPEISPILNIVPIQILSYFLALERGLDPDKPRNLAKSVTVK